MEESSRCLDGSSNEFRTSPLDGNNEYQLWKLDEDGRLVNRASGKYFNYEEMQEMVEVDYYIIYSAECPKNMSFFGKMAITTFKIMQNAKVGGVL